MADYAVGDLTLPDPWEPGDPEPALVTGSLVPGGPVLAAPTVDSDLDGLADTTAAPVGDELVLATDLDHDGLADVVTRLGPEGVVTARHGVDGLLAVEDRPWGVPAPPAPTVDPRTGVWTRG